MGTSRGLVAAPGYRRRVLRDGFFLEEQRIRPIEKRCQDAHEHEEVQLVGFLRHRQKQLKNLFNVCHVLRDRHNKDNIKNSNGARLFFDCCHGTAERRHVGFQFIAVALGATFMSVDTQTPPARS